jgi:hypothetical protein
MIHSGRLTRGLIFQNRITRKRNMSKGIMQQRPGRPRMSHQEGQKRAESIYRLWLMQWSVSEIAESMHLNRTTVWRCVQRVRGRNALLAKSARERFSDLAVQIYDMTLQTIREAWRAYHSSQLADQPRAKSLYLGRVQAGIAILTRFMPDLQDMDLEEKIAEVEARHKGIARVFEERRQNERVLPHFPPTP